MKNSMFEMKTWALVQNSISVYKLTALGELKEYCTLYTVNRDHLDSRKSRLFSLLMLI